MGLSLYSEGTKRKRRLFVAPKGTTIKVIVENKELSDELVSR